MATRASHPDIINRLKRAEGHLRGIIAMLERERSCLDIAQQLQALENAVCKAKKAFVHAHIDHSLEHAARTRKNKQDLDHAISEFKAITKYL